jgi:single-strand DNA-binding protein
MSYSINKVILVGNLGRDPEARNTQAGGKIVGFSVATSESWTDKASGERREKTQWHRIAIFNETLADVAEKYLRKGSKVYVEGQLEGRKYQAQDGTEREAFEVVVGRFRGDLVVLDPKADDGGQQRPAPRAPTKNGNGQAGWDRKRAPAHDDDIPF